MSSIQSEPGVTLPLPLGNPITSTQVRRQLVIDVAYWRFDVPVIHFIVLSSYYYARDASGCRFTSAAKSPAGAGLFLNTAC